MLEANDYGFSFGFESTVSESILQHDPLWLCVLVVRSFTQMDLLVKFVMYKARVISLRSVSEKFVLGNLMDKSPSWRIYVT